MGELKPCPFCGGEPHYAKVYDRVDCETDDCRMSVMGQMNPAQWNHRTMPPEVRAVVGEMPEAVALLHEIRECEDSVAVGIAQRIDRWIAAIKEAYGE